MALPTEYYLLPVSFFTRYYLQLQVLFLYIELLTQAQFVIVHALIFFFGMVRLLIFLRLNVSSLIWIYCKLMGLHLHMGYISDMLNFAVCHSEGNCNLLLVISLIFL
ncbi:hypothetical protein PVAP13_4KG154400 [Panicum virgatum]|uniref:Uncharacterized protein n=1 Tax=Panicum virgatum TaxID=38727 RepID=A0A8T0TM07_PANVG|nr:hypothetical protein PVAP13_4KG154400 [Panicum virgatum]